MASKIIIDGYNLIRQSWYLGGLEAVSLEEGRNGLIRLLASYNKNKGHSLTVVFDGWDSDNIGRSREKRQGIEIVYTGRGEKADDYIKKRADELRDALIVVTSDREIESYAVKRGAVVIPSAEFESKMNEAAGTDEEAGVFPFGEEEDDDYDAREGTKKKGPARKASRKERRKKNRLRKL